MLDWSEIETVLLDMDGTLLDLHFDDFFWQKQLPQKWGELNGWNSDEAMSRLVPIFQENRGTLPWYCLDYWSDRLGMDVFTIKNGIEHLIQLRPHVSEFLHYLNNQNKKVVLVTNSHEKFISLKMEATGIAGHFDNMFNSHAFGFPKEDTSFWKVLAEKMSFNKTTTILIDDNLSVLRSAREYGIRHLFGIEKPSSKSPVMDTEEFRGIASFRDLCL